VLIRKYNVGFIHKTMEENLNYEQGVNLSDPLFWDKNVFVGENFPRNINGTENYEQL
jgi:hypothetical protein